MIKYSDVTFCGLSRNSVDIACLGGTKRDKYAVIFKLVFEYKK